MTGHCEKSGDLFTMPVGACFIGGRRQLLLSGTTPREALRPACECEWYVNHMRQAGQRVWAQRRVAAAPQVRDLAEQRVLQEERTAVSRCPTGT